jgi:hypothetical protein
MPVFIKHGELNQCNLKIEFLDGPFLMHIVVNVLWQNAKWNPMLLVNKMHSTDLKSIVMQTK